MKRACQKTAVCASPTDREVVSLSVVFPVRSTSFSPSDLCHEQLRQSLACDGKNFAPESFRMITRCQVISLPSLLACPASFQVQTILMFIQKGVCAFNGELNLLTP